MIKAVKKVLFRLQNSRPHSINPLPNTLHVNLHAATRLHAVCPAQHLPRLMAGTLSLPFVSETNDFCYISRRLISVKNRCLLKFVFNRIISWLGLEIHDPPPCRGYGLDTELPTKGEAVMCWAEQGRSTPLALIPSPNSTHHHHTGSDSIPHHSTSLPQPCFLISNKDLKKKAYKEKKAGSYSVLIITKRNCILPSYWNLPQGSVVVFLVFCKKEKKKKRLKIAIASAQQMWSLKKSHAGAWLVFTTGAEIIWVVTLVTTLQVTARPILWWKYRLNLCYIWENVTSHL